MNGITSTPLRIWMSCTRRWRIGTAAGIMWRSIRTMRVVGLLGSQEGLAHIALAVTDPGDVVLVPDPCYPIFGDGPTIAGAELYPMTLHKEKDYLIDFDEIPEEVAEKARLMVVSYPNNPTTALARTGGMRNASLSPESIRLLCSTIMPTASWSLTGNPPEVFWPIPGRKR